MTQICKILSNSNGKSFAGQINAILEDDPTLTFVAIHSSPIQKIGGTEYETFAVFRHVLPSERQELFGESTQPQLHNGLIEEIVRLRKRLADYESSFDLYYKASMSLMNAYMKTHAEWKGGWPDTVRVNQWAADLIEKAGL